MKIGRCLGSMLGSALLLAALTPAVRAQPAAPGSPDGGSPNAEPVESDRPSPTQLMPGPSLYETGRIGTTPQAASTAIEPEEQLGTRREKSVEGAAATIATPGPKTGVVDQNVLDQQIEARFAPLEDCRVDVARAKRVKPAQIIATTLTLRWTIQPGGVTADTLVVASSPVDLDVMSCVKSAMSRWKFIAPRGGPVRVERLFTFRPLA
jgi:hypothetical protein